MKKLLVNLPFLKTSTRFAEISRAKFSRRNDSKKETSNERTRKYWLNLKLKIDQRKLDHLKIKTYKTKLTKKSLKKEELQIPNFINNIKKNKGSGRETVEKKEER
jgi:hypothetical protein